jgi:hypothetical protein
MTDVPEMSEQQYEQYRSMEAKQEEVKVKTRFEVDCLLMSVAATNPELSPGLCRRLVVDALRTELARIQEWSTWDIPIICRHVEIWPSLNPDPDCPRCGGTGYASVKIPEANVDQVGRCHCNVERLNDRR